MYEPVGEGRYDAWPGQSMTFCMGTILHAAAYIGASFGH